MRATDSMPGVGLLCALALFACERSSPHAASPASQQQPLAPQPQEAPAPEAAAALDSQSIYHLQARFTDQGGRDFDLASLRGSAVLAAMFYASCTSVCPMLISQIKRLDGTLPADTRAHTQVVLVTLDPAHDDTVKLEQLATQHEITSPRWHFLRTAPEDVRALAALLGVRYRALPSGDIIHSASVALLDRNGVVSARLENADDDPAALLSALDQALGDAPALAKRAPQ